MYTADTPGANGASDAIPDRAAHAAVEPATHHAGWPRSAQMHHTQAVGAHGLAPPREPVKGRRFAAHCARPFGLPLTERRRLRRWAW